MAAVELEWIPETLYNTAISAVVDNYIRSRRDIRSLPENIQFDVYYKVRAVGLLSAPLRQPRGPHPLPRLRTLAVNPSPLVAGSPPETSGAVSRLPIGIPCLHVLCLKLLGLDWYLFLMRLPVFWCSLLHCALFPPPTPVWVGLLRGLPLLRPCPTQSFTSSLCLPDIFCPLPR